MNIWEKEAAEDYAAADREYYRNLEDDSPRHLFQPDTGDVVEWLAEQDGDVFVSFLDEMDKRWRENKDATIYVLLADFLDDHYAEIEEFING